MDGRGAATGVVGADDGAGVDAPADGVVDGVVDGGLEDGCVTDGVGGVGVGVGVVDAGRDPPFGAVAA